MVVSLQVVSLHDKVDSLQSCRVFSLTLLVITRLYFILNFSKLFNTKSWLQRIDFMMQRNDFIMQRNDFVAKRPFHIFLFRNKDSSPLKVLFKGVHWIVYRYFAGLGWNVWPYYFQGICDSYCQRSVLLRFNSEELHPARGTALHLCGTWSSNSWIPV